MRAEITILDPLPPELDITFYGPYEYGVFGFCAWQYSDDCFGKVEWLNLRKYCTEPEYSSPQNLIVFARPGVLWTAKVNVQITGLPPATVAGTLIDAFTGKGFPLDF